MKAIIYNGKHDIEYVTNKPEPTINHPTELKIKIDYCGICGSDLHEILDGPIFFEPEFNSVSHLRTRGQILGHEMSGTVVEIGSGVTSLKVGDSVVVESVGGCNDKHRFVQNQKNNPSASTSTAKCSACHDGIYNACDEITFNGLGYVDGGFSEYTIVAERHAIPYNAAKIPADVAALCEPLSVAWHGVRISNIQPHQRVLVLGAGPIGLCAILCLKAQLNDPRQIVVMEPALARRKLAEQFGVITFDPSNYKSLDEVPQIVAELKTLFHDGFGFHQAYECSGIPLTFEVSVQCLRTGGHATNLAIWPHKPLNFYPMSLIMRERTIGGSLSYVREDFEQVVSALESGAIPLENAKALITAVVSLDHGIENGFEELIANKSKHIKVLVTPKSNVANISSIDDKVD